MSELKALLFDVDGTLADTEEVHRECFNRAFADAGLDWNWSRERYGELLAVTGGKERIRHFLDTQRPDFSVSGDLSEFIAGLHAAKTQIYTDTVASGGVPLRPGVRRVLETAREAGLRLAIATTTTPANVTALLQASLAPDAEDWFEVIAAGSMVPHKKPAPDIYFYALEKMGLTADECLAFEDSENGVKSARQANIPTLVTESFYTEGQDFSGAEVCLTHLGEPDQPFQVLAGDAGDATFADLDFLRELHQRAVEVTA